MKSGRSFLIIVLAAAGTAYGQRSLPAGQRLRNPAPIARPEASASVKVRSLLRGNGQQEPAFSYRRYGTLRFAAGFRSPSYGGTAESAALAFLREYAEVFGPAQRPDFEVSRVRAIGQHTVVRLRQMVDGIPVHGKDLVLTLDSQNAVEAISANYALIPARRRPWLLAREKAVANTEASAAGKTRRALQTNQAWFVENGEMIPSWQLLVEDREKDGHPSHWSYVVSAETGDVLETQDARVGQSREASAFVYPTNPLASDVVPVTLSNLGAGPYLFGDNAKVYSNLKVLLGLSPAGSVTAMASADSSGNYPYKPMDPRHAEVQLYWAMDRAARNFRAVGYPGLGRPLEGVTEWADCSTDGCASQNNAYFDPFAFSGRGGLFIYYCRTGEPTYDTGVMFHEFAHSVVSDIVGPQQGSTFRALNEGTADYFSSSFLEDPADTPYAALIWGMKLPYLRTVANQNFYPRNLVGEAHLDGNIWSGALWELRQLLGAANADTAVLLTIASISASAEYYDAATAAVNVTALLFGHEAAAAAETIFTTRGLLSASAEFGANPHFLRSGALPVVDSIGPAAAGGGIMADRQFRFSVPVSGSSFTLRLLGNDTKLIALLKHRSPVVVYDDGTTNADYISDVASQIDFHVDQSSDPEIQFGEYYLWVGHYNTQASTEYAVYMKLQATSDSFTDIRLTELAPNGEPVSGSIPAGPIINSREFFVRVPDGATGLGIQVEGETDMDLYVKYAAPVLYNNQGFPEADVVRATSGSSEIAILTLNTVPILTPGIYVVGVYNSDDTYPSHFRVAAVTTSEAATGPKVTTLAARSSASVQLPGALGAAVLADTEFAIDVPEGAIDMRLSFSTDLDSQVYIRRGSPIAFSKKGWPLADYSFKTMDRKVFDVTTTSATPLQPGRYYVWIANASDRSGAVSLSCTFF